MFPQSQMPNTVVATDPAVATAQDTEEQLPVDLDAKVEVADASKDINVVVPPPKAGEYIVQWELGEKGIEGRSSKKVGSFLLVPLVGHIVLEGSEYNNYQVQDWITSIYSTLKQNAPTHDFLYKLGVNVPQSVSLRELQKILEETLAQKPFGTVLLEWKLSEKNPSDPRADRKTGYVTLKNRMDQFPRNPDGTYQNWIDSKVDGSKLYAQAVVAAHLKK